MRLSFTKVWTWIVGASAWYYLFALHQDVPSILRDAFLGLVGLHYVKKIPAVRERIDSPTLPEERFFVRGVRPDAEDD